MKEPKSGDSIMKITCYDLQYDYENDVPILVKDRDIKYMETTISSPSEIFNFLKECLNVDKLLDERAHIIALDNAGKVIGVFRVGQGNSTTSVVDTKGVFVRLLLSRATHFIFTHNHPNDSIRASMNDIELTKNLKKFGDMVNIKLLDHIITGTSEYQSLKSTDPSLFN